MDKRCEKIRLLFEGYASGLYTKAEATGQTIDILADSPDFVELWDEVPDWVQSEIWQWLRPFDENTILYDLGSAGSREHRISLHLISLKAWLIREGRYR